MIKRNGGERCSCSCSTSGRRKAEQGHIKQLLPQLKPPARWPSLCIFGIRWTIKSCASDAPRQVRESRAALSGTEKETTA